MKLKKLFAGIVAVAMVATMGAASVLAEGGGTQVTPSAQDSNKQVSIDIVITGTGYGSETVKLDVGTGKPVLVKNSSYTTESAPENKTKISVVETNGGTITEPANGNTASKTLHIQLPDYDRVGTYVYKFNEVAVNGTTAGMTYDTTDKWLLVNVYNDVDKDGVFADNSAFKVNAVVLKSDPTSVLGTKDRTNLDALKIDQIENQYNAGTFKVTKKVQGNMSDRQKDFNFRVTFEKVGNTTVRGAIKVGGIANVNELAWDDSDSDNKMTYNFKLHHNQTATFTNVPYDMKVSVVELDDSEHDLSGQTNGEYTVTYENTSGTIGEKSTDTTVITEVNAVIKNKSEVNVDTGVILDNAPYIALLTIVAAGAVVMILKKRRTEED